jgi:hypothetical protein
MSTKSINQAILCALAAVAFVGQAHALDLMADYQKAKTYDPSFQTAIAERQANQASATQARVAYLPSGSFSNMRIETDNTDRRTLTISQPIIDLVA